MTITPTELKRTPLYDRHVALGGKMVEFAGYCLPIQYTSIKEEHLRVRNSVGVFDVSHLGEIRISGSNAKNFLQHIVPTDLSDLNDSSIRYTLVLNEDGGILDDVLVYRFHEGSFYLVVNASNIEKIYNHLQSNITDGVVISDESDKCCCIAVQGPGSTRVCEEVFGGDPTSLGYYQFKPLAGWDGHVWISRSGYTGEDGFEYFSSPEAAVKIWDELMKHSDKYNLRPCGLGARNTLRLEVGNALYGHEMNETTAPQEAKLGWLVNSPQDYIGKASLEKRRAEGFRKKIIGFRMSGKAVARDGYKVFKDGVMIGSVTSGSYSPTLESSIGLASVDRDSVKLGDSVDIEIHGKNVIAQVVKLPFVPIRHI